ncbi:MAG: serine hydrolase [Verrucomicrobiales bacterium]|nr:serine hydrolase [Verrucomicrobiales bacterium]
MKPKPFFVSPAAIVLLILLLMPVIQAASPPPDLDVVVERARKEFTIPGIAIAIVQDGQKVVVKGYGVRTINEPAPVDPETIFNIASNSKGFTAAALAMLVDEGKLRWDDPVTKHLPTFQLFDPWVTREITLRDILSHRSGLGSGAGDLLWWPEADYTPDEIVFRLRFIKPATSFRSEYAYNNCLYIVAGQVLQAAAAQSWDAFIRDRVFAPLGMKHSSIGKDALPSVTNKAISHLFADGRLQTVDFMNGANEGPAGGINSCVEDMAQWAIALLEANATRHENDGKKRLFSREQLHELWSIHTPRPTDNPPPDDTALKSNFSAYGLGFELSDMAGRKIVSHLGSYPGQRSGMMLIPDLRLGIVVLSNLDSDEALGSLMLYLVNHYVGAPNRDWIKLLHENVAEEEARMAKRLQDRATKRQQNSKPSLPLEKYAGDYVDAWYGKVSLRLEEGTLVLRFNHTRRMVGNLEHWQHDTFVARWRERTLNADAFVYFALKPDGAIDGMKLAKFSPKTDFSFDFQDLNFKPAPAPAAGKH